MAKTKRSGARVTFSVSVSASTKEILQQAADRRFGGNVSALVEAVALEAQRHQALDTMLERMPRASDEDFEAFMQELEGKQAGPSRRGSGRRAATRARAKPSAPSRRAA